ncbi:MAG: hypothetical protein LBF22_05285 [Deltaproteobacteria bacterium]|jgi:hypothetical protein|nr:hypothetical protein [Deltaproteobacteria bacterium]
MGKRYPRTFKPCNDFGSGETKELTSEDFDIFNTLTNISLSPAETELALEPTQKDPEEKQIFALHFHPEWVPLELIDKRLQTAFPNAEERFAIPTQHNVLMTLDTFTGVEADVFVHAYGLKIQLLIHLKSSKLPQASTLEAMINKTFKYRELQLLDVLEQVAFPDEATQKEIKKMGFHEEAMHSAQFYATKLKDLINTTGITQTPRAEMLKNRLLTDYIEKKAQNLDSVLLDRLLSLVNHLKKFVKARLNPSRFHTAQEIIEESRALGAGIVIPHPPQFWPALLDNLDVDGFEVWNPSTPAHTFFLIQYLAERKKIKRPLLAFMGDDTHMSSKIRPQMVSYKDGNLREIGFQPPWKDPKVIQALKDIGQSRERTYNEYMNRLM